MRTLIITDPCLSASHNAERCSFAKGCIITDPCLSASHNADRGRLARQQIITDPCGFDRLTTGLSASHNKNITACFAQNDMLLYAVYGKELTVIIAPKSVSLSN